MKNINYQCKFQSEFKEILSDQMKESSSANLYIEYLKYPAEMIDKLLIVIRRK